MLGSSSLLERDLSKEASSLAIELSFCADTADLTRQGATDGIIGLTADPIDLTAKVRRLTGSPLLVVGGEPDQAVSCMDLGADAWLPRSAPARLILAATRRLIQRDPSPRRLAERTFRVGNLRLDAGSRRAWTKSAELQLAPREFDLLGVFASNPGIALSRDRILAEAWGPRFVGEPKTVDVHVAWLRQKLDGCGVRVTTIRGLGYRLDVLEGSNGYAARE